MSDGMPAWVADFPGAVTVTGADGTILYLNEKASTTFAKNGGKDALVGSNLGACHKEASRVLIKGIQELQKPNAYTITKGGVHKFIYQAPWYHDGRVAGLVELSMEIPAELPHFDRG